MKYLYLICFLSLAVNAESITNKNFGDIEVLEVTSIYDGDTFRVNLKGVHPIAGERMPIRVANIDTPEIRGKCAKEKVLAQKAKQFTVNFLRTAKVITLKNMKRGKYFRIVADVYNGNQSLGNQLVKAGLAVKYFGKRKNKKWCE